MNFAGPQAWNSHAEYVLRDTFGPMRAEIIESVRTGRMQLWQTDHGFLITECLPELSEVFLWCYAGSRALALWIALAKKLQGTEYTHIGCFTKHRQATWLFRKYNPEITLNGSEYRIRIAISELAKYEPHHAISSTLDEKSTQPQGRRESTADQRQCAL